jgi:uncharacterized Zn finger protein
MLHIIHCLLHSFFLRHAFCSQGEHKRETVTTRGGHLVRHCLDCGRVTEIGPVFVHGSNRKVQR